MEYVCGLMCGVVDYELFIVMYQISKQEFTNTCLNPSRSFTVSSYRAESKR